MKQREVEAEIETIVREAHNAIAQAYLFIAELEERPLEEGCELRLLAAVRMFGWCATRLTILQRKILNEH